MGDVQCSLGLRFGHCHVQLTDVNIYIKLEEKEKERWHPERYPRDLPQDSKSKRSPSSNAINKL